MSEHWLQHAHGRIVAGDDELDVLADYGWVQITDEEREAVKTAMYGYIAWMDDNVLLETPHVQAKLATLRSLLERLHT